MPSKIAPQGQLERLIGRRYIAIAYQWKSAAVLWGGAAAILGLYYTDWQVVMNKVPFYGGKFKKADDEGTQ